MFPSSLLAILVVCLSGALVHGAIDKDLVTNLPLLTYTPTFKHYSGYLNATGTRKLHYWFTECASDPANAPLVLWLNGGPGCSSLDGLLSEHGPFRVNGDGSKILPNSYSWNKVANMLYLEAPAGVGYSYDDDGIYTTSDDQVSLDNHWALKAFLKGFPEYAKNDFFITGESYGGIYVPTLASRVMDDSTFNFKGFAVGNGLSDYKMNTNSLVYFAYYHGLIGSTMWSKLLQHCCQGDNCDFAGSQDPACQQAVAEAQTAIGQLNMYNMYAECFPGSSVNITSAAFHPIHIFLSMPDRQQKIHLLKASGENVQDTPPCIDSRGSTNYLNRADVRKALHIPSNLPAWTVCSTEVEMHYQRQYMTMFNIYTKVLAAKKYRILLYNGDIDMACNFLGDEWFVDSLGLPVKKPRYAWMYRETDGTQQVGGFSKSYENLICTTVRGAGHMVPQDKPIQALQMFTKFLKNQDL